MLAQSAGYQQGPYTPERAIQEEGAKRLNPALVEEVLSIGRAVSRGQTFPDSVDIIRQAREGRSHGFFSDGEREHR
jgi:hypothetical protein